MQLWWNSIHVAVRSQVRCVVLRAASLASDECEHVQDRSDTANVSRNTHEPILHAGMFVRQGFNAIAHFPQPVNFQQKILESHSHPPLRQLLRLLSRRGRHLPDLILKTQFLYQAQRCCLAKEGKKQSEQLRNQSYSGLAILIHIRWDSTSSRPCKPPFTVTCTALSFGDSDLARAKAREASE